MHITMVLDVEVDLLCNQHFLCVRKPELSGGGGGLI